MSFEVTNPFPVFTDLKGEPLENGNLFIGTVSLNPETNPISVFFDEALTIPAAQPIRTIGGYPSRDGTPSNLFVTDETFSITVRDKNNKFVFSKLGSSAAFESKELEFMTDIETSNLTGINRVECNFRDSNKFAGGGGIFVLISSGIANSGTIIEDTAGNLFRRQFTGPAHSVWFGADPTGIVSAITATQAALDAHGNIMMGSVGDSFLMDGRLNMPDDFVLDWGGSTMKCNLSSLNLFEIAELTKASFAVITQTLLTSQVILSATPSGLAVGEFVSFEATDIAGNWPISLRQVKVIAGPIVTLDSELDFTYTGTVTMRRRPFNGRAIFKNGIIDGSGTTAANQISFLKDYETELWENITFKNFDLGTVSARNIVVSRFAKKFDMVNCRFEDIIVSGQYASVFFAARGTISDCGGSVADSFGFAFSNSDDISFDSNKIRASFQSGGVTSTRGLKVVGCFGYAIFGNTIREFDSGIKIEDSGGGTITGNILRNNSVSINVSHQNPTAAYHHSHTVVANDIYENRSVGGAINIGVGTEAAIVSNNNLYNCQGVGIICTGDQYNIDNNNFFEWSIASPGTHRAISTGNALKTSSVTGNRMHSANPLNVGIGIGVGSTDIQFSDNRTNTDVLYQSIPAIPSEIDVELQNGTFLKVLRVASVGLTFGNTVFANPFPNAIHSAIAVSDSGVVSTNIVVNMAGSDKTKIRLAATTAASAAEVWCIGS